MEKNSLKRLHARTGGGPVQTGLLYLLSLFICVFMVKFNT